MADGKWIAEIDNKTPLVDAARRTLRLRLETVQEQLPLALQKADEDPEHVHQLRVATRRAGAAVRIFASCLPGKAYRRARKTLRLLRRAAGAARDWDVFFIAVAGEIDGGPGRDRPGPGFLVGPPHARR